MKSESNAELVRLSLPESDAPEGTIGGVPIEALLTTPGTGGGRRRAGLFGVAALLGPLGIDVIALAVAGDVETDDFDSARSLALADIGATVEWVGADFSGPALARAARAFAALAPPPGEGPALWTLGHTIIVDLCIGGRRPGFCILQGPAARQRPIPLPALPFRSFLLAVAGMLRADSWRRTIERLVNTLAQTPLEASGPVTSAQEAVAWAAREAGEILEGVAQASGHPEVSVHLPDPDDGLVWDLAVRGGRRRARHAGVSEEVPEGLPYDWIAAEAMTPAAGTGRPMVRRIGGPTELRALLVARGLPLTAIGEGPWTVAQRPLSRSWSPSRRNLVVVLSGRPASARWAEPEGTPELGPDEQGRLSALVERVHDRVMAALAGGLARWRDTLRASVLVELERRAGADGVARALAAGLGAGAVTLWQRDGDQLRCVGAAGLDPTADLPAFSISDELLDPREHGLLRTPLFRSAREVSEDGFLLWNPMVTALGEASRNVGTVPLRAGDGAVGLLRIDNVRPVFAGLVSGADAPGLRTYLPDRVPAHAREVLDEVARWFSLVAPWDAPQHQGGDSPQAIGWRAFMATVESGRVPREAVEARLHTLAQQHPSRGAAAEAVGVHRNTFRRHLSTLAALYGAAIVPWD